MLHLKTKAARFEELQFALLVEPDIQGLVHSDKELYNAVRTYGKAIVAEFEENAMRLKKGLVTMTPKQFEQKWVGD